jgi:hypothetical protein
MNRRRLRSSSGSRGHSQAFVDLDSDDGEGERIQSPLPFSHFEQLPLPS